MTAAQARIAETLETFYGAGDRTSDGAMAGHAYKRSVEDLDGSFGRELVSQSHSSGFAVIDTSYSRTVHIVRRYPNRLERCARTFLL